MARERITLELTPEAKQSLALDGLDPVYGARPLKRLIQRQVVDNVANLIIDGKAGEGDTVKVDVGDDDRLFAARDDAASEESRRRAAEAVAAEASAGAAESAAGDEPVEPDSVE